LKRSRSRRGAAPRRAESQQDVPVAVSIVQGKDLEASGATSPSLLSTVVPGIASNDVNARADSPTYSLRGQVPADNVTGSDQTVGIYSNEFYVAHPYGMNNAFFDLENVQVLKGPQGTLFGRNTTGGAVLLTTARPADTFGGYLTVKGLNYGLYGIEGAVSLPLGERAGLRLAATANGRDGFITNPRTSATLGMKRNQAFRATLVLKPTDSIISTTVASYLHADEENEPSLGVTANPGGLAQFELGFLGIPLTQANGLAQTLFDNRQTLTPFRNPLKDNAWDIVNITTYALSDNLTIKNVAGYRKLNSSASDDIWGKGRACF
jgi:iron complex outermembrane receptor protein